MKDNSSCKIWLLSKSALLKNNRNCNKHILTSHKQHWIKSKCEYSKIWHTYIHMRMHPKNNLTPQRQKYFHNHYTRSCNIRHLAKLPVFIQGLQHIRFISCMIHGLLPLVKTTVCQTETLGMQAHLLNPSLTWHQIYQSSFSALWSC